MAINVLTKVNLREGLVNYIIFPGILRIIQSHFSVKYTDNPKTKVYDLPMLQNSGFDTLQWTHVVLRVKAHIV